MEILLKKDVDRLGSKDEIVTVKNGFGRNYLIPKGMAILATESVKKMNSETLKQRAHKFNQLKDEALKILDKLSKKTFEVPAKVGENGKIFGSISNIQLADALDKAGFKIERKNITLPANNIKEVGKFEAEVILSPAVPGQLTFALVAGSFLLLSSTPLFPRPPFIFTSSSFYVFFYSPFPSCLFSLICHLRSNCPMSCSFYRL